MKGLDDEFSVSPERSVTVWSVGHLPGGHAGRNRAGRLAQLVVAVPGRAATVLWVIGVIDYLQPHHSIRRIYPVIGRMRWLAEDLRPKIRQYFVESDTDGAPYTLDTRADVYDRAKGGEGIESFGTRTRRLCPGIRVVPALDLPQVRPKDNTGCASARPVEPSRMTWR